MAVKHHVISEEERDEFRHGIHALQDKVIARPARRFHNTPIVEVKP